MFRPLILAAWLMVHCYVLWRILTLPLIARRLSAPARRGIAAALCLGQLGILVWSHFSGGWLVSVLEFIGMDWLAVIFLHFLCFLAMDLITLFGFLFRSRLPAMRTFAVITGLLLSVIAIVQGMRAPVVREYTISMPGLPAERDGLVVAAVSDLHLGNLLGEAWLKARIAQIQALHPDLIVLIGDIFEGHGEPPHQTLVLLHTLQAPLGVWAVAGNHDGFGPESVSMDRLERMGFYVLHDRWGQACPGLIVAGVDDLTLRRRRGEGGDPIATALAGRPPGATLFLSHTPWGAEEAAALGAGLMLAAHTHGGQIWPLGYLVKLRYPLFAGRYDVNGIPVLVTRGAGTWGPRMRLWAPGEILRITLRASRGGVL